MLQYVFIQYVISFTPHLTVVKTFGCNKQAIFFYLNVTDVRKKQKNIHW